MSECEFDYPFRWPQIYESLLSRDNGRFASAVALLTERDRMLEDHLRNRECQNSARLSDCRFEYPYRWEDFAVPLCLGDENARAAAIAVAELNLRGLEDHLWRRPCCAGDPCLFEHPFRWTEIGPELTSGDTPRAQRAVALLDENDRALEDHLRNRSCGSCFTPTCTTQDFNGDPDHWNLDAGFAMDDNGHWYGVNYENVDGNMQIVRWDYPTFDNYTILYEFAPTDLWPTQITVLENELFWFSSDGSTVDYLMSGGDVSGTITPTTVYTYTKPHLVSAFHRIAADPVNHEIVVGFGDTDYLGPGTATFITSGIYAITPGGSIRTRASNTTTSVAIDGSPSGVLWHEFSAMYVAADGATWGVGYDESGSPATQHAWREQGGSVSYVVRSGPFPFWPIANGDFVYADNDFLGFNFPEVTPDLEYHDRTVCGPQDNKPATRFRSAGLPVYTSDFSTIAWYHERTGLGGTIGIWHADTPV